MAAKKYYGVRKGKITGVFNTWEECKKSVDGFPGAEYKGFVNYSEACEYAGITSAGEEQLSKGKMTDVIEHGEKDFSKKKLLTYVDGSFDLSISKYSFGCVFILSDGRIYVEFGNGNNPQSLQHRNVTGEMLGAMFAVKTAMMNGFEAVEICYDYQGIEKWVTGEWRSKTELTQKYTAAMREWSKSIQITFTKVAAHTNVKYNELADKLAKRGLTEGNGVPKVRRLEEMEYYGTDSAE